MKKKYILYKKDYCEFCGYKGICLTIDHKDSNILNNHPDNLQTLCELCHLIKDKPIGSGRKWQRWFEKVRLKQLNS